MNVGCEGAATRDLMKTDQLHLTRRREPGNALGSAYRRNPELIADLSGEAIVDFPVARNRSFRTGCRI